MARPFVLLRCLLLLASACLGLTARAAEVPEQATGEPTSFFPHPDDTRWWVSGQVNVVAQAHPTFAAQYSGVNSLKNGPEAAASVVATVYGGFQLSPLTDFFLDLEFAGGDALSEAGGLGGFPNLDVLRNPDLPAAPYVARAVLRQVIPLTDARISVPRNALSLLTSLPTQRLEIRVGRFSTVDVFDPNSVGSDSHFQFLNWAVDQNGAYDYAADTRGYSVGGTVEYDGPMFSVRFGEMLMPTLPNGINLDTDFAHARADNLELEWHGQGMGHWPAAVRLLGFINHAKMGNFADAIAAYKQGLDVTPDLALHRHTGAREYGLGLNAEQALGDLFRVFLRIGWDDGANESFAYTEINNTVVLGGDVSGKGWARNNDRIGLALATNGLSAEHAQYLKLGGTGFVLGDGNLRYGREDILETYYDLHIWRGLYAAVDVNAILNPGYNKDRGPVYVGSFRVHLEL